MAKLEVSQETQWVLDELREARKASILLLGRDGALERILGRAMDRLVYLESEVNKLQEASRAQKS